MNRMLGLAAATVVLFGCSPPSLQPAANNPRTSVHGPIVTRGYLNRTVPAEHAGGLPSMPWPKFEAGLDTRAHEAELAIIWRGHELSERHPGATPGELAELLAGDHVWEANAKLVQPARRTVVIREALTLW
jgi:hypothetical protein